MICFESAETGRSVRAKWRAFNLQSGKERETRSHHVFWLGESSTTTSTLLCYSQLAHSENFVSVFALFLLLSFSLHSSLSSDPSNPVLAVNSCRDTNILSHIYRVRPPPLTPPSGVTLPFPNQCLPYSCLLRTIGTRWANSRALSAHSPTQSTLQSSS